MIKKNILLILFLFISIPISYATVIGTIPPDKSIDIILNNQPSKIQPIDILQIIKGSIITDSEITLDITNGNSDLCQLQLIDNTLNEITISNQFQCNGQQTIKLNEYGNDALETKSEISFAIEQLDSKNQIDYAIKNYNISYKEPTYYALIENDYVVQVIVADKSFVDSQNGLWIETSFDDSFRSKHAGIGDKYDSQTDSFITEREVIPIETEP